ncbi:MAG: hypothetical protein AB8B57_10680 [Congregibacter sp.]
MSFATPLVDSLQGRTGAEVIAASVLSLILTMGTASPVVAKDWETITVLDVTAFPDDEQPRFYSQSKSLFRGPGGASLIWARFGALFDDEAPNDPLGRHYHHFHEWALVLDGDYVIHEPVSPRQKGGALYQYVQGTWLDRPAYTLHGGAWANGGKRAQMPCTLLIFEEGDGSVVTIGPNGDHFKPDFPESKPAPYMPDWTAVKSFAHPWIVDTVGQLEWERDDEEPGLLVKWLSDDPAQGFRARLIKAPPGWSSQNSARPSWYASANRFLYITWGDLRIQAYDKSGEPTAPMIARKDWFVHQAPRAPMSHGSGPATAGGAIWLEVTYARGITHGDSVIEAPIPLR